MDDPRPCPTVRRGLPSGVVTDDLARRAREALGLLAPTERPADDDASGGRWRHVQGWLAATLRAPVPPRLLLRPDPAQARDPAPACGACGLPLRRVVELSACTACLGVVHRRCWPDALPCRCVRLPAPGLTVRLPE